MLHSEESDDNVDDNDGATSSSSRLESRMLQPIDRTHAWRLLFQMMGAVTTTGVGRATTSQASQESAVEDHSQPSSSHKSIFSKFAVPHVVWSETENSKYCNSPTEHQRKMTNCQKFTGLVRVDVVRTLLSIPASSVQRCKPLRL